MTQPHVALDAKALEAELTAADAALAYTNENARVREAIRNAIGFLASLPQQTAEPVAWRFKSDDPNYDDAYVYCATEEMALLRCPKNSGVEPLYIHPASPPVALASSERSGREAVDRRVVRWQPRGIGSNWNIPDLVTGVDDGNLHPDMSGFVHSKAEGELAVDIFGGNAFLDWRPSEPNWIQVKVSAPEPVLAELERLVRANDNLLTPAIVAAAIRNLAGTKTNE